MTRVPIEITVSYSEVDTARQCPLKHALAYDERWVKSHSESSALGLGTLWHLVMEAHRTALSRGASLPVAREAGLLVIQTQVTDPEVADLLTWMYEGYLEKWGADREWRLLGTELAGDVLLPPPQGWPETELQFRLKFKIDLLFEWQGRIWVLDEKSCKDLPKGNIDFDFDDQFGLYYWAATQLGYPVFGAMYSGSRKTRLQREMTLDERFVRIPMHRNSKELRAIAEDAWQTAYFAYERIATVREARIRGATNVEHARHTNPRECKWKCDYRQACIMGRKGRNLRVYLASTGFRQDRSRH